MNRFFKIALFTLLLTSVSALFARTVTITNNTEKDLTITAPSFYALSSTLAPGKATKSKNTSFSQTIIVSNADGKCSFKMNQITGNFNGAKTCSGLTATGSASSISIK